MAFYHTRKCDCPVGCCDCGPVDVYEEAKSLTRQFAMNLVPKDLFMYRHDFELFEGIRAYDRERGPNTEWIGQVDDAVNATVAIQKMEQLEAFMLVHASSLPRNVRIDQLYELGRWLCSASSPGWRPSVIAAINDKYSTNFQRVISDWRPVF